MRSIYDIRVTPTPYTLFWFKICQSNVCIHVLSFSPLFSFQSRRPNATQFLINEFWKEMETNIFIFHIHTKCQHTNIDFKVDFAPLLWNNVWQREILDESISLFLTLLTSTRFWKLKTTHSYLCMMPLINLPIYA